MIFLGHILQTLGSCVFSIGEHLVIWAVDRRDNWARRGAR